MPTLHNLIRVALECKIDKPDNPRENNPDEQSNNNNNSIWLHDGLLLPGHTVQKLLLPQKILHPLLNEGGVVLKVGRLYQVVEEF